MAVMASRRKIKLQFAVVNFTQVIHYDNWSRWDISSPDESVIRAFSQNAALGLVTKSARLIKWSRIIGTREDSPKNYAQLCIEPTLGVVRGARLTALPSWQC